MAENRARFRRYAGSRRLPAARRTDGRNSHKIVGGRDVSVTLEDGPIFGEDRIHAPELDIRDGTVARRLTRTGT